MNFKALIWPLVVFLSGMIFTILGALLKILHWTIGPVNGGLLLAIGSVVKIVAIVFAIVILIKMKVKK